MIEPTKSPRSLLGIEQYEEDLNNHTKNPPSEEKLPYYGAPETYEENTCKTRETRRTH